MRLAPYEAHMLELQRELLKAQRWVEETGQRIIILFEAAMPPARAARSNVSLNT